jgi:hypothetical protein
MLLEGQHLHCVDLGRAAGTQRLGEQHTTARQE